MKRRRIQRRRTKGWRMPKGSVYVGRGSKWGNPFRVDPKSPSVLAALDAAQAKRMYEWWLKGSEWGMVLDRPLGFASNRNWILWHIPELRGKNLACWCPLDQPCHADVLLGVANAVRRRF